VLAAGRAAGAELGAHGQSHAGAAAGHERQLGRLVEQLVEADADEVEVHDLDDGAHAGHGRSDTEPDDRGLGDRRVEHPLAEALLEAPRQAEDVATVADVDAGDEHALVGGELGLERVVDRVHHPERRVVGRRWRRLVDLRARAQHEVEQRRRRGRRRRSGGAQGSVEIVVDRRRERVELVVGDPDPAQHLRVHDDRVVLLPRGELLRGAVPLRVALVVPVPAVRRRLDQDRGATRAGLGRSSRHGGGAGHDVVAVDPQVRQAVAGCPPLEGHRVLVGRGRELGVAVVLAPEHDRQAPDRCQVDRLVEGALCHGAVAEEGDRDTAVVAQPARRGRPDRDGEPGPDDAVRAEDAQRGIRDVHRPASTAVGAGVLRHQLGEHRLGGEALGQAVPVAAMGRGDDVGGVQRPAGADRRGLLAGREVHETGHLAVAVQRRDPFLEASHDQHAPLQLEQVGPVEGGRLAHPAAPLAPATPRTNTSANCSATSAALSEPPGLSQRYV
jgi:hypothetical protein